MPNNDVKTQRQKDFYNGIEHFACWLLDNVEGETITEEQLRPWAAAAWSEKRASPSVPEPNAAGALPLSKEVAEFIKPALDALKRIQDHALPAFNWNADVAVMKKVAELALAHYQPQKIEEPDKKALEEKEA